MNIGVWNIDHPETQSRGSAKEQRFREVVEYLLQADCEIFIITEANAAIELPGYYREFSSESPFKSKKRFYGAPNSYHQVAIYSRKPIERIEVEEPINGVLCKRSDPACPLTLYGNVVTIKDRWSEASSKTYADRLDEQIRAIQQLHLERTLIAGDFNLRVGWQQTRFAHRRVKEKLGSWVWPTENRDDTVQHLLHSPDLQTELSLDFSVKGVGQIQRRLSDHPFIRIKMLMGSSTLSVKAAC